MLTMVDVHYCRKYLENNYTHTLAILPFNSVRGDSSKRGGGTRILIERVQV